MATVLVTDGADGLSTISVVAATNKERVAEGDPVEFTFTAFPPLVACGYCANNNCRNWRFAPIKCQKSYDC